MEILDKESEKTLKKIIEQNITQIDKSQFDKQIIEKLIRLGLLKGDNISTFEGWRSIIEVTRDGQIYFAQKNKFIKSQIFDWLKYGITTLIAIIALIISIVK